MRKIDKFLKITGFISITFLILSVVYFLFVQLLKLTDIKYELPFQIIFSIGLVFGAVWCFFGALISIVNLKSE